MSPKNKASRMYWKISVVNQTTGLLMIFPVFLSINLLISKKKNVITINTKRYE